MWCRKSVIKSLIAWGHMGQLSYELPNFHAVGKFEKVRHMINLLVSILIENSNNQQVCISYLFCNNNKIKVFPLKEKIFGHFCNEYKLMNLWYQNLDECFKIKFLYQHFSVINVLCVYNIRQLTCPSKLHLIYYLTPLH